jgi:hypothetical protein
VEVFRKHSASIGTISLEKGLTSDGVLTCLKPDLLQLGFQVEEGKQAEHKIERPVFFGENGVPTLRYEIDAFHPQWGCGLEVEAGRAWMGNAVYRDLVQAMVMVGVEHLVLAVPICYKYNSAGRATQHDAYKATVSVADALYSHGRVKIPYSLTVVGY